MPADPPTGCGRGDRKGVGRHPAQHATGPGDIHAKTPAGGWRGSSSATSPRGGVGTRSGASTSGGALQHQVWPAGRRSTMARRDPITSPYLPQNCGGSVRTGTRGTRRSTTGVTDGSTCSRLTTPNEDDGPATRVAGPSTAFYVQLPGVHPQGLSPGRKAPDERSITWTVSAWVPGSRAVVVGFPSVVVPQVYSDRPRHTRLESGPGRADNPPCAQRGASLPASTASAMAVASAAPATTASAECRSHRATPSGRPVAYAASAPW